MSISVMPEKRMDPQPSACAMVRFRVALEFSLDGDLRYLSHHDEMRMLARAVIRARWPVLYTQGFNPKPKLSLPVPRNLGTASLCEWALIELREPRLSEELAASLVGVLPPGATVRRVIAPAARRTQPSAAEYEVSLNAMDAAQVATAIADVLARNELSVERRYGPKKPARRVDLRPYVETIGLDGLVLRMRFRYVRQNTARPSEILTLLGLAAEEYNHLLRRCAVDWNTEPDGDESSLALLEGTGLEQEEDNGSPQDDEASAEEGV